MQDTAIAYGEGVGYIINGQVHVTPMYFAILGATMLKRTTLLFLATGAFIFAAFITPDSHPTIRMKQGGALHAFEFWYTQRAAPYEKIPSGAFLRAAEYSRTVMPKERELTEGMADTSQWTSIGPDNVGGRVLAVAIDPMNPNTLWAGAASGGLWKSTTAGVGTSAWSIVNTGHPTLAVSSIAINPSNTNIMYIGTGEVGSLYQRGQVGTPGARTTYGMGVLKSTDGGVSWNITSLIFTFPQLAAVQKVLLNPSNPNTIYAITTEGTYKSTNAASTWSLIHTPLMGMDIVINPSDTTILYAVYGQRNSTVDPGIYKTTNAGATWTLLAGGLPTTNFGRTSLALSPSSPNTVYAGIANASTSQIIGLYRTTNAGTSWTQMSTTNYVSSQGWYDNVIAVHPTNAATVLASGLDIYKSTTNGSSLTRKSFWSQGYDGVVPAGGPEGPASYAHADHHAITYHPTDPNIVYFGCDGGIFISTDGGETFDGRNGGFATTQFYNGLAAAETDEFITLGGLQDNGTVKYTGGLSWDKTYGGDGGWCAIDPTNANIMYEEYVYLAISKTTNGGASWFGLTNGLATGSTNANFIAPFVISPSHSNILYAGARVVYKTTNGGTNWFATNGGVNFNGTPVACIGVSHKNPDTLIAGTGSGTVGAAFQIFRSTNGGTSWTNVTGSMPNRYPTDISFDPNSSTIAYITFSGYGASHVFKSTDAGATWNDITANLPDVPTQSIVVDPLFANTMFVGTDLGVYRTLDGGTSWHVFDTGMPPAMVLDLVISNPARSLRAATFGNGVYERSLPPSGLFDYRALSFVSPPGSSSSLVNTSISPISAGFSNIGGTTSIDSFDVRYRILLGNVEQYADTRRIPPLAADESRTVAFTGSYTPTTTGTYTLQAISLASDENVSNDTLNGTLEVVAPGTIATYTIIKRHRAYEEIAGGGAGPSGDDAQSAIGLPFQFEYDSFTYDSLQISTNGWAELGTGVRGSERGLSTAGQLGLANQNGTLFSTARPTKTLAPWLEDLSADGSSAVTYATIGAAPHRIFIVQWKNILAYYDDVLTTTRVNFQLRLLEGTNILEYHYGPVAAGTFAGSDIGAMVGMKDHLGGDYHFMDFFLGGTGTAGQGFTTLNPLTDWPGPDSCYAAGQSLTTASVPLIDQWNLVSVPLTRTDNSAMSMYTGAVANSAFRFNGSGYVLVDSLAPGSGYWMKMNEATTQPLWGNPLPTVNANVTQGWNLVGSVDHDIPTPSGGLVESFFFEYTASGYSPVSTISPGHGYWVKTNGAGVLALGPTPEEIDRPVDFTQFTSLTIADGDGRSQKLFVSMDPQSADMLQRSELPPLPPSGMFDARFESQRLLEAIPVGSQHGASFGIVLQSAQIPLRVTASLKSSNDWKFFIEERRGSTVSATHALVDGATVEITAGTSLSLRMVRGGETPMEYAIAQNYPNPFNPTTRIEYALPEESKVRLTIYDVNGREVLTLVNATQPAGYLSVNWDGTNSSGASVSSGVYFFRITAQKNGGSSFSQTRKMVLMK
ncbi:MAG: FlgD immunoglobulin-like domain containing protein [Bacteroidota bacterium]